MTYQQHSLVTRILHQLPADEQYALTARQIELLHQAANRLPKTKHPISVRWSIPFPGAGFYIVFFAGKERRSRERLKAERDYWLMPKLIVLAGTILGCATVFGLAYGQYQFSLAQSRQQFSKETSNIHPVVVPFKQTQGDCENSGREWVQGDCVDRGHSHDF